MPISANPQASDLGFCDHETDNLGLTQQSPRQPVMPDSATLTPTAPPGLPSVSPVTWTSYRRFNARAVLTHLNNRADKISMIRVIHHDKCQL